MTALREQAHRDDDGLWWFSDPAYKRSEADALKIAEACVMLGVPVDDRMSSAAWLTVVRRIAALEERIARLENA
jgi:hypothetical protein